jgi:uncharacterized protein (DUF488 family)
VACNTRARVERNPGLYVCSREVEQESSQVGRNLSNMTKIFTVGYEQHARPADLISVLRTAGIRRLVDVRELPLSRRRGFSKTALLHQIVSAGMQYDHVRPLGNPKPFRDLYRSGRQEEGENGYLGHLRNGSASAVDKLAAEINERGRPTCLLCFEADHATCHRDLLVQELRFRLPDLEVEHL